MTRRVPTCTNGPEVDIVAGREPPPHTQAPDWVALADIPAEAHSLHVKLKMHVNRDRGDSTCWPGTDSLAEMMGVSRGDKVTPWLQALERIGAINIIRGGANNRNTYVVHSMPPAGHTGPTTLKEWYQAKRDKLDAAKDAAAAKRATRRASKKRQAAPGYPENGGTAVTPKTGEPVTPDRGAPVTPFSGREQDVREPDVKEQGFDLRSEGQNPPPPPSARRRGPRHAKPEGERRPMEETAAPARAVLELLAELLAGVAPDRHPTGAKARALSAGIAEALGRGWDPKQLRSALGDPLDGARSVYAVLKSRIDGLGDPPAPPATARPACTSCSHGWIEVGDKLLACPLCRPTVHATQLEAAGVRTFGELADLYRVGVS